MLDAIWLLPALPLAGFVLIAPARPPPRRSAGRLAGHGRLCAAAFVLTVVAFSQMLSPAGRGSLGHHHALPVAAGRRAPGRHGLPGRPALHRDGAVRHRHRRAHPPLRHRVHARRPEVLQVLPVPEPVRVLDAHAGPGLEPGGDVPRLGGRGRLLLLPDLVLADPADRGDGGQEGVHHQPGRRRRLHDRHVPHVRGRGLAELRGAERRRARRRAVPVHGQRHRGAAVRRRGRQVGAAAALPVAARRHGGPDAGLGPHPRRHHGDGRGVPDGPGQPRAARGHGRAGGHRHHRRGHRASSRPPSPWPRTTSSGCWPTPPSASWATCSWPWAPAPTWPRCST